MTGFVAGDEDEDSGDVRLVLGDCLDRMAEMEPASIDAIVCDPPYGLKFLNAAWDHGVPGIPFWRAALRVAKPGAHLVAFGGTRTHHRLTCAIEDAGWEIRDGLVWLYGCLSDDTEILVDGEWVHYRRAIEGRHALCYNADDDTYQWQPIQRLYVYDHDATAYRIESEGTDQIVTRNHRCLVGQPDGRFGFRFAEDAAREREIRVPVLEDMQGLLDALPLPRSPSSRPQGDVLEGVRVGRDPGCQGRYGQAVGRTRGDGGSRLCGVREGGLEAEGVAQADRGTDMFAAMQRSDPRGRVGDACEQGSGGLVRGGRGLIQAQAIGADESFLAGRDHLYETPGQLSSGQVGPLPGRIRRDASPRRLRDGASAGGRGGDGSLPPEVGSRPSCQSRRDGQPGREPDGLREPFGAQALRGARHTRADLARITPVHYRGVVWCIQVPTGAFVARRNGKVFVTGNSGMPKSLDVSKALDKAAGAPREVIGCNPNARPNSQPSYSLDGVARNFAATYGPLTAPATDAARQWAGWGTGLKPAWEPIILARAPFPGTVAANVQINGCGALNIDACRIGIKEAEREVIDRRSGRGYGTNQCAAFGRDEGTFKSHAAGRWPANAILSHTPDCRSMGTKKVKGTNPIEAHGGEAGFSKGWQEAAVAFDYNDPDGTETVEAWSCSAECPVRMLDEQAGTRTSGLLKAGTRRSTDGGHSGGMPVIATLVDRGGDSGGASRFFYCSKASPNERGPGNTHPTVKPLALMRWLVRLVSPPGATVLDPFMGSGTTALACLDEGMSFVGIEQDPAYLAMGRARIAAHRASTPLLTGTDR